MWRKKTSYRTNMYCICDSRQNVQKPISISQSSGPFRSLTHSFIHFLFCIHMLLCFLVPSPSEGRFDFFCLLDIRFYGFPFILFFFLLPMTKMTVTISCAYMINADIKNTLQLQRTHRGEKMKRENNRDRKLEIEWEKKAFTCSIRIFPIYSVSYKAIKDTAKR